MHTRTSRKISVKYKEGCIEVLMESGKIYTTFDDIKVQKGIKLTKLLFLLPNTYEILMDWMKDTDDDLCMFANTVLFSSLFKQIDVYNTILNQKEDFVPKLLGQDMII